LLILKLKSLTALGIGILLNVALSFGQSPIKNNTDINIKHKISFRHDNDFLTFSDQYYSSGLFLQYSRLLKKGLFSTGQEKICLGFAQEIYTPSRLNTTNIVEMDRPYAGYMEFNLTWNYIKPSYIFETQLSMGIVGKASGAGAFHRWYHNALDVPNTPTWAHEINNKVHSNIYVNFIKEWHLVSNNFSVYLGLLPKLALGTKDINAQSELIAHFGKRQALSTSMAYDNFGNTEKELFFSLRIGYQFVNHNAMLQGHLFGDDSIFLVEPKKTFLFGGFELKHRFGQNDYWFGYRVNSSVTETTSSHSYIMLSYARSF
jgi:hypothetical protein